MSESQNKRIARNALMLYLRTFITVGIGLFTGRVVLQALGISDYGINTVVGGIIAFSGLITGTMSSAVSRYLTFSLGEGNLDKQKEVFATSVNTQIIMSFIVTLFLEAIGIWWLNVYAKIPEGRLESANWVLQLAILGFAVSLVSSPYRATIVSHEHFKFFALISILESILKLSSAFIVLYSNGNHLVLMALLNLALSVSLVLIYCQYSRHSFEEVRYKIHINRPLLKEMATYAGWNMLGNTTWVFNTQGVNMLINMFHGVAFNATRGIATTVAANVQGFVNSFTTAFAPPITKSYASGEVSESYLLVNRSSRYTWFLTLLFFVPIIIESQTLLSLWLVEVPPLASLFLQLAMLECFIMSFQSPLFQLIQATGKVRRYNIEISLVSGIVFPVTWVSYTLGASVWCCYIIASIAYLLFLPVRLHCLRSLTTFSIKGYLITVILPCCKVTLLAFLLPTLLTWYWEPSTIRFIITVPVCLLSTTTAIFLIGFNEVERDYFLSKLRLALTLQTR